MNGSSTRLSAKQNRAVLLMASGSSATEVAKTIGVSKGTIHNWKSQNKNFKGELESVQRELFEEGLQQLAALVSSAASALQSVLGDPQASHRDKISAARAVLQFVDLGSSENVQTGSYYSGPDEFLKRMRLK